MSKITHSIVHLTSVHPRYDTRIFLKECSSLVTQGYDVTLVVADGRGNEEKNGVTLLDVGASTGRINRILRSPRKIYRKALELDAELYHLHDPELIPIGVKLKKLGKKVIFDAHEDFPKQLLGKPYLNPVSKRLLAGLFSFYERLACRKMDAVITATPFIRKKFVSLGVETVCVSNFPLLNELANAGDWKIKKDVASYVGGIARIRGVKELVQAFGILENVSLNLGGNFSESGLEKEISSLPGWDNVDYLGFLDRQSMNDILAKSKVGIVTFLPSPNHIDAQPNKMFEYMSAGIPIVTSNFPLWMEIVEGHNCGICVDPEDPKEIAGAIQKLILDDDKAYEMGRNGRLAVEKIYNWESEVENLYSLYDMVFRK